MWKCRALIVTKSGLGFCIWRVDILLVWRTNGHEIRFEFININLLFDISPCSFQHSQCFQCGTVTILKFCPCRFWQIHLRHSWGKICMEMSRVYSLHFLWRTAFQGWIAIPIQGWPRRGGWLGKHFHRCQNCPYEKNWHIFGVFLVEFISLNFVKTDVKMLLFFFKFSGTCLIPWLQNQKRFLSPVSVWPGPGKIKVWRCPAGL